MKYKKRLSPEPKGQFQPTAFECPFPRGTDRGKKESALMTLKKSSFLALLCQFQLTLALHILG